MNLDFNDFDVLKPLCVPVHALALRGSDDVELLASLRRLDAQVEANVKGAQRCAPFVIVALVRALELPCLTSSSATTSSGNARQLRIDVHCAALACWFVE